MFARFALIAASRWSVDYCASVGIAFEATTWACGGVYLIEAAQSGRFFAPVEGGELMAWVDVFGPDAETPVDAVAWPIDQPDCVLTLVGEAVALGEAAALNSATYAAEGALRLHRRPVDWLRSGCEGACIVDQVAGPRWLLDLPPGRWAAEDRAHAAELLAGMQGLIDRNRFVLARQPQAA